MAKLRFGVWIPSYAWPETGAIEPIDRLRQFCERADAYGIDLWAIDHLLVAPGLYGATWLDPLTTLTYAAALTRQVGLGTGVLVMPLRNPVLLAKEIASLQALSGGRFILGAGPGWYAEEFKVSGTHISERGRRTDEMLAALEVLLSQEQATYQGRYYQFENVTIHPRPGRMPPVWVAGGSRFPDPTKDEEIHDQDYIHPAVVRRIIKWGNWLARNTGTQEWLKRDWRLIREQARKLGQDPDRLTFGHVNFVHFSRHSRRADALAEQKPYIQRVMGTRRPFEMLQECYMLGTLADIIARVEDLADAGLTYLCLGPCTARPEDLEIIGRELMPRFA